MKEKETKNVSEKEIKKDAKKNGQGFRKKLQRITRYLSYLNPKNLNERVQVYGYTFSWKSNFLTIACTLLAMATIGIMFRLKPVYFTLVIFIVILMFPMFVLFTYQQMFEQKRFADAVTYAEQILYSFQKSGKIVSALKETADVFEGGKMKIAIEEAIEYIENGYAKTEDGVLKEALSITEKPYDCAKIRMAHRLLISSEEHGGEMDTSLLLLLDDIESWKRRGYKLQAEKKASHKNNIVSTLVATLLCITALYALDAMGNLFPVAQGVDMFAVGIIQFSSFVFILFLLYVLSKSFKSLTTNWLKNESLYDEEYIMSCYMRINEYDEKKENKKSMLVSSIIFLGALLAFCFNLFWLGVFLIIIAGIVLIQHKISYNMAKKDVNDELYLELPQWLVEIALLLQNNNVQVSIIKSVDDAPPLLQVELFMLVERLELAPEDIVSYVQFCKRFDIPEAQSCMKMLHAISESGTGNSQVQINNLLKRVQEMQDMADNIQAKEQAFKMKMLFSYPVLGATAKLLVDLTVGMFYMFTLIGSIGGA